MCSLYWHGNTNVSVGHKWLFSTKEHVHIHYPSMAPYTDMFVSFMLQKYQKIQLKIMADFLHHIKPLLSYGLLNKTLLARPLILTMANILNTFKVLRFK